MIYSLSGKLISLEENYMVIECAGVGYQCFISAIMFRKLVEKKGKEITVFTFMTIRDDAVNLFAFLDRSDLKCFKMLTSVSGVGAKAGLSILSEFSADQIAIFISNNDSKSITRAQGVGNKLAQRIVLELRDKMKMLNTGNTAEIGIGTKSASSNADEALKALLVLGYSKADIVPVISKFDSSLSVEELIRLCLKSMK